MQMVTDLDVSKNDKTIKSLYNKYLCLDRPNKSDSMDFVICIPF